jgi:thiol-disulfide isomerase/thioredoxin
MRTRPSWYAIFAIFAGLMISAVLALSNVNPASADSVLFNLPAADEAPPVVIYFFWGDGCPHCAVADPVLDALAEEYPSIELKKYEVWYNDANLEILRDMAEAYNFDVGGVPAFFIADSHWVGYNDQVGEEIRAKVEACLDNACPDAGAGIVPGVEASDTPAPSAAPQEDDNPNTITVPLIGVVDLTTQSMLVSTLIIAFVDGFNPCSLWVLSMLLALTLHTGSRKKVFIIGLTFITITALVYVLFITGLFSLLTYVSFLGWIQAVVAVVAIFFALVNIKDYFFYKEGVSFTIGDKQKSGILAKIRGLMDSSQTVWGLLGATVVIAGGVSLVEFACTAGFPVLWTNLLTAHNVQTPQFILLLIVYMLIYQLDELAIFLAAVFTLKASKLEEKHGRVLKLIGGMLMFVLALVIIFDPARMNSIGGTLVIFGIAFAATLLVLLLHRRILPAFGIWIGSEKPGGKKKKQRRH